MNLRVIQGGGPLADTEPVESDELVTCSCGDAWFEVNAGGKPGAISIQRDGRVAGLVGELRCASCGRLQDLG